MYNLIHYKYVKKLLEFNLTKAEMAATEICLASSL